MMMRSLVALSVLLAAPSCGSTQGPAAFDTGNMAYPQSVSAGEFRRPAPVGFDTGSMSLPTACAISRHESEFRIGFDSRSCAPLHTRGVWSRR